MTESDLKIQSTTDGLPVAPSLAPALESVHVLKHPSKINARTVVVILACVAIGSLGFGAARILTSLIALFTNLSYYGRFSLEPASPAGHTLGTAAALVPVAGGIVVGLMARFGSRAIRGHGIPEAMERVLVGESRIPARVLFLKPLSAAIAIGTGGPFGAEGPVIATGGALGSLIGQVMSTSSAERKTLLAAGAAAGMTAVFGSPVSAILLAIELLLFEFKPRSFLPVAFAVTTAGTLRAAFEGTAPVFAVPHFAQPGVLAIFCYVIIGALTGVVSVGVTKSVYFVEDLFEKLPLHWCWWPAIGGLAVGIVGLIVPRTLGVGYDNIEAALTGSLATRTLLLLAAAKFVSWAVSLGSGTSGGTLAPLMTLGSCLGPAFAISLALLFPHAGIDPRIAALVGMAAMFTGASRALLASVVFAFETTREPMGLLPLLGGCSAAYLISSLMMRNTIMTEKLVRRGLHVPSEYSAEAQPAHAAS